MCDTRTSAPSSESNRLELREGSLPPRVLGLVMEWAELHQAELRENWTTLAAEGNFKRIAPLV